MLSVSRLDSHSLALDLPLQPSHPVVLIPAAVAVLILALTRRSSRGAFAIAATGGLLGLLAAAALLAQQARGGAVADPRTIGELKVGPALGIPLRLQVDRLMVLVAVAVALVSLVVQVFARWYLYSDPRYRQFAATVGLFTAAMQLVVLSGDVLLVLVGWELMGWCSYLLIGHESERGKARRASYKAFLVTRIADAPFAIGLAVLALGARSTSIPQIVQHWPSAAAGHGTALTAALLCIICAVAGKSAQVPFQDWLPDAMEGPTPASALIHAATMVAAGTVVLAKLVALLELSGTARIVLTIVASVSMVGAAVLAFCQHDLKRLLAWSTVSQVGLMLLGLAVLPVREPADLGISHLLSHAMFKALLFLMIGWLSVLVGGTIVERQSGALSRHPALRRLVGVGLLALAGVPPLVGFVSKDLVVDEAARRGVDGDTCARIAFVALICVVALTAAYTMRMWLILIHRTGRQRVVVQEAVDDSYDVRDVGIVEMLAGSPQVDVHGRPLNRDEPPVPVPDDEDGPSAEPHPGTGARIGLQLLAILSVVGGLLVLSPMLEVDWKHANLWLIGASLVLMAAVALLVRLMSVGTVYGDAAARLPLPLRSSASRGFDADQAYVGLVARPVVALARGVARLDDGLDRRVQALPGVFASIAATGSRLHTRRPTSGLVAVALGVVLVGLMGVIWW
ncbi:NADH-quinone oxidoreductase subunit L [Flexivirga sp. ID2601S]|uniref:NADH-quinone oxidoreductase subunit L n=1 Tax=Flexivirga aerilata TaxID=1656889 RepID=A0A849AKK0_9MICO|nr:NADH-quinone oxidoreductase subunit L [Flexivirga aerilata]NNG38920.1 NADH-quinone oxidoreductase subunit L [Flexivirga aerilata]